MRRYSLAVAACLLMTTPAWAQVPPDIAAALLKIGHVVDTVNTAKLYAPFFKDMKEPYPDVRLMRDISYGPDPLNRLDVFVPQGAQAASGRMVVIYAHGGQMQRGDKHQSGSPYYDNLMLFLTQHGMIGVNMDYRLAPKNHWPDAQQDVGSVIRWVKANIGQYGGDPNRIVLWGQSAGAGLIAGYLSHPEFYGPDGAGVKGAAILSGHYNLGRGSEYYGQDPAQLRERAAVQGMTKLTIPVLASYTEVDIPGAPEEAQNLKSAMCDAGHCPTLVEFKDHSHMSQVFSVGTPDTSVSGPVLRFLTSIK